MFWVHSDRLSLLHCNKSSPLRSSMSSSFFITSECDSSFPLSGSSVEVCVVDNGDGSYGVSYTPAEAGLYSVWVCVKAQHVQVTVQLNQNQHVSYNNNKIIGPFEGISVMLGGD